MKTNSKRTIKIIMHTAMVPMMAGIIMVLCIKPSTAAGIGVELVAGGGSFLYNQADTMFGVENSIGSILTIGCGFIADTNLGTKSIFNYRFKIGYNYQYSENEDIRNLHRVTMTHIFGAALFANDYVRLWFGPQIGVGYLWGSHTYYSSDNIIYLEDLLYNATPLIFSLFNIHAGLSLGININAGPSVTIPVEGGFRYNFYIDFLKSSPSHGGTAKLFEVIGPEGYVSVGVMYRFNENEAKVNEKKTM
jgi:hypothetical protein